MQITLGLRFRWLPWYHNCLKTFCTQIQVTVALRDGALAELRLRPEDFPQHLASLGFRLVRQLLFPSSAKGFQQRPMYLFERMP